AMRTEVGEATKNVELPCHRAGPAGHINRAASAFRCPSCIWRERQLAPVGPFVRPLRDDATSDSQQQQWPADRADSLAARIDVANLSRARTESLTRPPAGRQPYTQRACWARRQDGPVPDETRPAPCGPAPVCPRPLVEAVDLSKPHVPMREPVP